jgi:hypothetical protein
MGTRFIYPISVDYNFRDKAWLRCKVFFFNLLRCKVCVHYFLIKGLDDIYSKIFVPCLTVMLKNCWTAARQEIVYKSGIFAIEQMPKHVLVCSRLTD